jgi:hypothetical protein
MVKKIGAVVVKEIREGLPAFIFFLFLFHMIALTKAVSLGDYSVTALRATAATVGALIVAKAILLVEALPIARLFSARRVNQILWKTLLFTVVVLLFRFLEEILELSSKQGGIVAAAKVLFDEISWPIFGILTLWILGGLLLYCLASELILALGPEKVKEILFGGRLCDHQKGVSHEPES